MELYQLKTFIAVADDGNLTKAAERIHASQPAVSAHIKALEGELDVVLFVRTPRGMQLTDAGRELKSRAEVVVRAAEDLLNQARTFSRDLTGTLSIGLNTDPEFLCVADFAGRMAEAHPRLRLKLVQSTSGTILKDVRDRRLDAGFSFFDNCYPEVESVKLAEIPVRVVAPAAWSDRIRGKTLDQLAALPWIKPDMGCPFMVAFGQLFSSASVELTDYVEVDSEDVIRRLVATGRGISILKQADAEALVREGSAVICDTGPCLSLNVNFVFARCRREDPLVHALSEVVAEVWHGAGCPSPEPEAAIAAPGSKPVPA
ncbi:MAG: LysR family transcriptional regulator [Pseudomonadota bacterium]